MLKTIQTRRLHFSYLRNMIVLVGLRLSSECNQVSKQKIFDYQWEKPFCFLYYKASSNNEQASIYQLQKWIESCRKVRVYYLTKRIFLEFFYLKFQSINPNLGSFLLRSQKDDTLCCGDLYLRVNHLQNSKNSGNFLFFLKRSFNSFDSIMQNYLL